MPPVRTADAAPQDTYALDRWRLISMRDGLGGELRANRIPRPQSAIPAFYPTTTRQLPDCSVGSRECRMSTAMPKNVCFGMEKIPHEHHRTTKMHTRSSIGARPIRASQTNGGNLYDESSASG
jgi:hypothetical protein